MTPEKTISRTFNEFEDFNIGDVVRLKSGGPNMTIDATGGSRLTCMWFDSSMTLFSQDFDQGAIEKVVPAEKPEAS
jgi:uncharacterized protein YodC (DUF2158 family)